MRVRGWSLRVLVRDPTSVSARRLVTQGAELVHGDVTVRQAQAEAMRGSDVLIHNAGVYEVGADAATQQRMGLVNVDGTRSMLEAALAAGVARTVYVSSTQALGPTGRAPAPSVPGDETRVHDGRFLTPYERSKEAAHREALALRERGLPLVIAMPNAVVGVNDHSVWGYDLRPTLLGAMPPLARGDDMVLAFVDVDVLADGLCRAAESAEPGRDYTFNGPRTTVRDIFALWGRLTGRGVPRRYLPRGLMRPQVALLEPLQRMLGLPAFLWRESVDISRGHLDFSSGRAIADFGVAAPRCGGNVGADRGRRAASHGCATRMAGQVATPARCGHRRSRPVIATGRPTYSAPTNLHQQCDKAGGTPPAWSQSLAGPRQLATVVKVRKIVP